MTTRTVETRLKADIRQYQRDMALAAASTAAAASAMEKSGGRMGAGFQRAESKVKATTTAVDQFAVSARRADSNVKVVNRQLDSFSGRLSAVAELALYATPAVVSIGALGAPALAGLASAAGSAALGAGVVLVAFQGVGDALKAVNKAALEPTAENIAAANAALRDLSPAASQAVGAMAALRPTLMALRDAGAEGFFPGFTEALSVVETRAPEMQRILRNLGTVVGDLTAEAGASLGGSGWDEFFDFLATDARDNLVDTARALGSLTEGFAQLWMSMDPLSDMGTGWLADAAAGFAEWAAEVDETQGFQEFVAYLQQTGPQVGATLTAVAHAVLQIAEAAAPLGGPVLRVVEVFADTLGAIADSDLGTPLMAAVMAVTALNRVLAITRKLTSSAGGAGLLGSLGGGGKAKEAGPSFKATAAGVLADARALRGGLKAEMGAAADAVVVAQGRMTTATERLQKSYVQAARAGGRSSSAVRIVQASSDGARRAQEGLASATERSARATAKYQTTQDRFAGGMKRMASSAAKGVGTVGAFAAVSSGVADSIGLGNTATLAMAGSLAGPWGTAAGAAVGLAMDMVSWFGDSGEAAEAAGERIASTAQSFGETLDASGKFSEASAASVFGNFDGYASAFESAGSSLDVFVKKMSDGATAGEAFRSTMQVSKADLKELQDLAAEDGSMSDLTFEAIGAKWKMSGDAARALVTDVAGLDKGLKDGAAGFDANTRAAEMYQVKLTDTERAVGRLTDRLNGLDAFFSEQSSMRAYESSLNRLQELVGKKNWDIGTDEGISNVETLQRQAEDAVRMFTGLKEAGKDAAAQKILTRAMADLDDFARKTPAARGQVDELLGRLRGVDREFLATLGIKGEMAAYASIHGVDAALKRLDGQQANSYINVITRQVKSAGMGKGAYDPRMATGGLISGPGSGTSDDVPIWASDGEFMQRHAAVRHYGVDFMEDVNAMRFPRPEGYASGGQIKKKGPTKAEVKAAERERRERAQARAWLREDQYASQVMKKSGGSRVKARKLADEVENSQFDLMAKPFIPKWEGLTKALTKAEKSTVKQTEILDGLKTSQDDLRSSIIDTFTSDLFAKPTDGWADPKTGPMGALDDDIADLRAMGKAESRLDDVLKGDALAAVLKGGLGAAQDMAGWTNAQLAEYQRKFDERARLASRTADNAGASAYGPMIRAQEKVVTALERNQLKQEKRLARFEARIDAWPEKFADALSKTAAKGKAKKK